MRIMCLVHSLKRSETTKHMYRIKVQYTRIHFIERELAIPLTRKQVMFISCYHTPCFKDL